VEAAGADVFGLLVHAGGEARDGGDGVFGDVELDASVSSSATYCLMSAFFGSVKMRIKSSSFSVAARREWQAP